MTQNYNNTGIALNNTVLASKGKRFTNFAIDMVVRYIIAFIIGIVAFGLSYLFEYDDLMLWFQNITDLEDLIFSYALLLIYYLFIESITQRSIGKYITGTKVIMGNGARPEANVIFIRSLCRFIPFDPLSFLGDKPIGWHDSLSKTFVIDIKKYEAELRMKNTLDEIGKDII